MIEPFAVVGAVGAAALGYRAFTSTDVTEKQPIQETRVNSWYDSGLRLTPYHAEAEVAEVAAPEVKEDTGPAAEEERTMAPPIPTAEVRGLITDLVMPLPPPGFVWSEDLDDQSAAAERATTPTPLKAAPIPAASEWPALGGSGAWHPMRGPWPKTSARQQWVPPPGWKPPTKPVLSWFDMGTRMETTTVVDSWYDSGARLTPMGASSEIASGQNPIIQATKSNIAPLTTPTRAPLTETLPATLADESSLAQVITAPPPDSKSTTAHKGSRSLVAAALTLAAVLGVLSRIVGLPIRPLP